jgi:uncharacterized protein DUF938
MKPYCEACERNREPILAVLKRIFRDRRAALEIASGTGQHAAYFAPELPHLVWQASDVADSLEGIRAWVGNGVPYGGRPTSASNARFDAMLRARDPGSGVRDFEHIQALAARCGLAFLEDNAMPANNRLLVFKKEN